MDSSESQQLWNELAGLRERVQRLEAQLAPQPAAKVSAAPEISAPLQPVLSFTQPEKPSLESRIGSQVFNRVGIVAVLVGVAWFLKYAVDRQWLGPAARVGIGFAAGLGLMLWSESFRRRQYPVFSFSLKAVGTGVLYLSLWASFSLFHLVPYPMAFAGMVLVTAANAWISWVQRSEVLAAYAAIGGFLTPALLAQEHTSVPTLGSYLLLLNVGLFGLAIARRWPRLLIAAFTGTTAYLVGLAFELSRLRADGDAGVALLLSCLFFAAFSVVPVVIAARIEEDAQGRAARVIAPGLALANAVFGGLELWRLVPEDSFASRWLPAMLAMWFAGVLFAGRLRTAELKADGRILVPWHAAFVIVFAALGIGSGLSRGGVVTGWALEAAVLLALTLRPQSRGGEPVMGSPVPASALLIAASLRLVALSLNSGELPHTGLVVLNERSALYALVTVVAVLGVRVAARQHGVAHRGGLDLYQWQWTRAGGGAALLATMMLLLAGIFEIHVYWEGTAGTAERFWISAWATLLGVGLLALGFTLRWAFLRWQALGLLTLAVAKVFLFDTSQLSQGFRILSFLGLGVLLLGVSFIYQRDLLNLRGKEHG